MFGFHAWDWRIVLLIARVIFGPRKLPEIGGALGKSIREFKKATNEIVDQVKAPEPQQLVSPSNQGISSGMQERLPAPAAPVEATQAVE